MGQGYDVALQGFKDERKMTRETAGTYNARCDKGSYLGDAM